MLAMGVTAVHLILRVHVGYGMEIAPFYLTGYTSFLMFRSLVNRAGATVESNRTLLYHRHVTLFNLCLARGFLDFASATFTLFILLALAAALGLGELPDRPLLMFIGLGLVFWLGWSLSMILAALAGMTETTDKFVHPATYLIMPFSGVFFLADSVPGNYRDLLLYMPLIHPLELIREGQFGTFDSPYIDVPYVVTWCMCMTLLGVLALRVVRPHLDIE